jgi:hypothetical protein
VSRSVAAIVWQTATAGAGDAAQVQARDPGPVLLLLPALILFTSGVVLLRLLPLVLRVAICAALAKRPRLLLGDEPTGELDARSTTTVIDLLLELTTATGAAALIVTHDMQVALRTSRTIHIRDGRLAAEGTARPVLIVDEHGWLRIPRRLRETAGVRDRVRASAA